MKLKSTVLLLGFTMMVAPVFAQEINDYVDVAREVLDAEKKVVIAEALQLTDAESGPFWDLYTEYNAKLHEVHDQRVEIITDFADNYMTMTDEKADELWQKSMSYQGDLLKTNKQYYKKFKKILPAGKAATYFQIENKIAALISAELALEIPLLEINK